MSAAHLEQKQIRQPVAPVAKHGRAQAKGFAASTAAITGESVRTIQRHIARAEAIGDDLLRLQGTSLDKGHELDALARMPAPARKALIDRAQAGEKVSAVAALQADQDDVFFYVTVKAKTLTAFRRKLHNALVVVDSYLDKKEGTV